MTLPGVCDLSEWPASEQAVVTYIFRDDGGELWLDVRANGLLYAQVGPFESAAERQRALDDLLTTTRSLGAVDLPLRPH